MITLSKEQVIRLYNRLAYETGGEIGIRDEALLESALMCAFQTFDGKELYPSIPAKIARITYSLISNHPFVDGNKRIGTCVMLILLELNKISSDFNDDEIINIGIGVASGRINCDQLLELIERRIQIIVSSGLWLNEEQNVYGLARVR